MSTDGSSSTTRIPGFPLRHIAGHWKRNAKYRSFSYFAADGNSAAVISNNAFYNPQAQPGALFAFCRDKRLKNCVTHLAWNTAPGICDRNVDLGGHATRAPRVAGSENQFAA